MDRSHFGSWGIELSRNDFARALAALGVLLARPGQRSSGDLPGPPGDPAEAVATRLRLVAADSPLGLLPWRLSEPPGAFAVAPPAAVLAEGWLQFELWGTAPRIEVEAFPGPHPFWLAAQLSLPTVGAEAVYVRADEPAVEVGWDWPMRVGFLDDRPSRRLRKALAVASDGWLAKIARLVPGSEGRCDLLFLPYDLEEALAAVLGRGGALRADCTVVLGSAGMASARAWPLVAALRAAVRTSGVALAPAGREAPEEWFREFMRSVSNSEPLDVALFRAAGGERPAPFLAAARALVEVGLDARVRRMAERFRSPGMRDSTIDIRPGSDAARIGLEGKHRLEEIASRLREVSSDIGWLRESDMASVSAELAGAAETAEPPPHDQGAGPYAPPEPLALRYLQVQVVAAGETMPLERGFRPDAAQQVRVCIGAPRRNWIHPPADTPFPSQELPVSEERHRLTVVLTAAGILDEPQVGSIELPREGDSSEHTFHLFVPRHLQRVEARIIVLHANRVLQTALLRGGVGEADGGAGIELLPEARVHASVTDLGERSRFDAALVLNHTPDHQPTVTSAAEGYADFFTSPDLQEFVKVFDNLLTEVGKSPDRYTGPLTNGDQTDLLRNLARNGAELYDQVVVKALKCGPVARARRLQVVSVVPDARLPVELFYERRRPAPDAKLCPQAERALRTGACDCPDDGTVVCPAGFWGVTRVLERYAEAPEEFPSQRPFAFVDAAERDRWQELEVFRAAVCGWTQRVPKVVNQEVLDAVVDRLKQFCGSVAPPVEDWRALQREVGTHPPTLLVLLVHTQQVPNQKHQQAELGNDSWLQVIDLDSRYVHPSETAPQPLVLMLGCGTGSPSVDFLGFAAKLRDAGAAIAVTSGAAIHAAHAVAAVERFLTELTGLNAQGESFGEVMRRVRANALAEGNLMILSLSGFGDADWNLVPHKPMG